MRKEDLAELIDVGGGLDKGKSDIIEIARGAKFDVGHIFFGYDIAAKIGIGEI